MKVAPLWLELLKDPSAFEPVIVHTGQHYDRLMSDVFLQDLGLPAPDESLGVGSGTHAEQTARVMVGFEKVCLARDPDLVVVVGDVNSTMAAAITSKKIGLPVAHVEAGLRSRDWTMPEEVNRVVTDAISDHLFTPSRDADRNLRNEGIPAERIHFVGNIMIDSLVAAIRHASARNTYAALGFEATSYALVTLHRPSNVDDETHLSMVIDALRRVDFPLVFPMHPRTRARVQDMGIESGLGQLRIVDPLGYYDFVNVMSGARFVITDSGGIQEETTYLGIPCLTLRESTERPITITEGTNQLVTTATLEPTIAGILAGDGKPGRRPELWDGRTAARIVDVFRSVL